MGVKGDNDVEVLVRSMDDGGMEYCDTDCNTTGDDDP